ncbi:hypothetical protein B4907_22680, partial [Yersinia kristensenii]
DPKHKKSDKVNFSACMVLETLKLAYLMGLLILKVNIHFITYYKYTFFHPDQNMNLPRYTLKIHP